jgi:GH25 family lysozyme M1 (1,4-beta-N-acetylmuramidase)/LysM repeat protein
VTTVRGIDLSNNNPRQNWASLAAEGVHFAFFKASEGNHTADARFSVHVTDAKAAGITVLGSYHFAWPNEDVQQNARNYIARVKPFARPGWVHWLDFEPYPDNRNFAGTTPAGRSAWVYRWITTVKAAFPGQQVGVYVGQSHEKEVPFGPRWYPRYPGYPAGAPAWTAAEKAARPVRGVHAVEFWQFADAPTDRSLWYGSLADLVKWAGGGNVVPAAPKPKPKPPAGRPRTVTVRAGMTLSGIALILGSSVTALAHYNHISDPNVIRPGQVISAPPVAPVKPKPKPAPKPKPKPKPAPAPAYTTYTVRRGDTVSGIAAAHGIRDWHTLAAYNHLAHPDHISVGQKLRIPKGK